MPRRQSAGPEFWPPIDRELYEKAARHGSRRSGQRRLRSLSSRTRRGLEVDYTVSLRWLQGIGRLHPDTVPVARWPGDTLEDMAIDMIVNGYSIASVHSRIGRLRRMLKVMVPDAELGHFDALLREFERPRARFDPIVWKVNSADLQSYGVDLMERADAVESVTATTAALYCCGLQIALIAARPWRKRQFALMELGVHLCREGATWRMRAHSHETKHRRYQSGLVPLKFASNMRRYINVYRVALCSRSGYSGNALWLNEKGRPLTPAQFLSSFKRLTEQKFEEPITIQAVRKIAATTMALHNPAKVHHAQGVLGHARYETGEQHYILAGAVQAHASLDATIDQLARSAKDRRRLSRRF
jgi:hypothetical protein